MGKSIGISIHHRSSILTKFLSILVFVLSLGLLSSQPASAYTFSYKIPESQPTLTNPVDVAVDSTDELVVYYEENGIPIYGEWFSEDGQSVGLFYLWKDRALIQVVNTGNVPEGMLGTYKGLIGPGLGRYK